MVHEALHLAIELAKILKDASEFPALCQDLLVQCLAIQTILKENEQLFQNDHSVDNLSDVLRQVRDYLIDCRQRRWTVRNPVIETLKENIPKYKKQLGFWIMSANLSTTVLPTRRDLILAGQGHQ